ncbi:sister chromatid cohesion protein Dcc1 [Scheffersomyces xylosifermentans]|uniref:sister chromatid cohesion protein Dcc1 n=1 Tax=Scheffersomyces xylosifermentans TaxID=1304137 RepID=UPI00315D6FE4
MESYSLYQQTSYDENYAYKFLQLPPDLLAYIKDNKNQELVIKSSTTNSGQLVVCSAKKTWKMRQMNHSNSVLLMDNANVDHQNKCIKSIVPNHEVDQKNNLIGFSESTYEYELIETKGSIVIDDLPRYHGDELRDDTNNTNARKISLSELMENSPISTEEFYKSWYELGGCDIGGQVYILSVEYITEVLFILITTLLSQEFNYKSDTIDMNKIRSTICNQKGSIDNSVLKTVINKFSVHKEQGLQLDNFKIAKWFGINELSKLTTTLVDSKEFLLQWKASLPTFYNVSLDLHYLRGHYCSPIEGRIRFVSAEDLSPTLSVRFSQLFQLDKSWNYDDFVPFIKDFVPSGVKVDSIILKFGKKKRVGKNKFVVTPRQ